MTSKVSDFINCISSYFTEGSLSKAEIEQKLLSACERGELSNVKDICSKYDFKTSADKNILSGALIMTCLYATKNDDIDIINCLIEKGADLNYIDEGGHSYLTSLFDRNHRPKEIRLKILEKLLEKGANPNISNAMGFTPLDLTDEFEFIELLLKAGADPNEYGSACSPLERACTFSHSRPNANLKVAKLLIEYGAKNIPNTNNDITPLSLLQKMNNLEANELIALLQKQKNEAEEKGKVQKSELPEFVSTMPSTVQIDDIWVLVSGGKKDKYQESEFFKFVPTIPPNLTVPTDTIEVHDVTGMTDESTDFTGPTVSSMQETFSSTQFPTTITTTSSSNNIEYCEPKEKTIIKKSENKKINTNLQPKFALIPPDLQKAPKYVKYFLKKCSQPCDLIFIQENIDKVKSFDPYYITKALLTVCNFANSPDHKKIAELLLDKGADPNFKDEESGQLPLTALCNRITPKGKQDAEISILKMLLENGADPNFFASNPEKISWPLNKEDVDEIEINEEEIIQWLKEQGKNPYQKIELIVLDNGFIKTTPLNIVSNTQALELLIQYGAKILGNCAVKVVRDEKIQKANEKLFKSIENKLERLDCFF